MNHIPDRDRNVLARLRVLHVEDEEYTRADVANLLTPLAGELIQAENGQEGLFAFAKHQPDVVIADIVMPVMDGLEFIARIRDMDPEIPVIVATSADDSEAMTRAINTGVGGYLLKPVDPAALVRVLALQGRVALARKELAQERGLSIRLRESIPFPVMILDHAKGSVVTANAAARRLGIAVGQPIAGPLFPDALICSMRDIEGYFEKCRDIIVRHGEHAAFGRIFDLHHRPVNAELAFLMAEDITERKRLEQLRGDVERITRHDLKSPLNVVINVPEILMEYVQQDSAEANLLRSIQEAGRQMLHVINLSLDLYKMETGNYSLVRRPVDVLESLRQAAGQQNILTKARQLVVRILADGKTPEPEFAALCAGDEILLLSMFANLLKNATEASPEGETVTVSVSTGDPVEIRIANQGSIPPEIRPRFFEKYATAGKRNGTGLGAYSAWLIAKTHGGQIGFSTSETEGTTVWLTLPAWPGAQPLDPA